MMAQKIQHDQLTEATEWIKKCKAEIKDRWEN